MNPWLRGFSAWAASVTLASCGARTGLEVDGGGGAGGAVDAPCEDGESRPCGSDLGTCELGLETCHEGVFGACEGDVGPGAEICNGLDENCDGQIDEPFGVGQPCDGPDSDLCQDDVMTCEGCSVGENAVELCNGVDDNCNGITDADCEIGECEPTLVVTGSTASSPGCIDFPVTAGSEGVIHFPCQGGAVTATLGGIAFTGTVENGVVSLDGTANVVGPDDCTWQTDHHIGGQLYDGVLKYQYHEKVISQQPWMCWKPCTEKGEVTIEWTTDR